MKAKNSFLTLLSMPLLLVTLACTAQDKVIIEVEVEGPAYVNFNLGKSPAAKPTRQELSLYGCNTEITTRERIWNEKKNLEWNTSNQVMTGVPLGWQQTDEDTPYFVSKYYQASPPVFPPSYNPEKDAVTIGLVIPDRFTFFGEAPVQQVFLDYEVLEPVYLNFVPVDYEYPNETFGTCAAQGVSLIPLNIECKDFKWLDNENTPTILGAKGASGIARIYNDSTDRQVFLPSYKPQGEECLDCTITILDDIMAFNDVWFVVDGVESKTVSLTDFYKAQVKNKTTPGAIGLSCKPRLELPAGCVEPKN